MRLGDQGAGDGIMGPENSVPPPPSRPPRPEPGRLRVLLGAAFLMATSAIGPGLLTQTVVFTEELGASFGFAILVSVLFDLGAQLNIWRTIIAARLRAHPLAYRVLPGLGKLLAVLVASGGLAFNVGNVAGAGLGLNALLGISPPTGAVLSAGFAVALFLSREAGRAMDRFAQVMGIVMVALTLYVAGAAQPPRGGTRRADRSRAGDPFGDHRDWRRHGHAGPAFPCRIGHREPGSPSRSGQSPRLDVRAGGRPGRACRGWG